MFWFHLNHCEELYILYSSLSNIVPQDITHSHIIYIISTYKWYKGNQSFMTEWHTGSFQKILITFFKKIWFAFLLLLRTELRASHHNVSFVPSGIELFQLTYTDMAYDNDIFKANAMNLYSNHCIYQTARTPDARSAWYLVFWRCLQFFPVL
jgi:hypothetical protein